MGFLTALFQPDAAQVPPLASRPSDRRTQADRAPLALPTFGLGLDFIAAVRAHRVWKLELTRRLRTADALRLDPILIAQERRSALGKWLYGDAQRRFGHLPAFGPLKIAHALFHEAAGEIVQLHCAGEKTEAEQLLRHGEYPRQSLKVMGLLGALHDEAARDALRAARPWPVQVSRGGRGTSRAAAA